MIQPEFNSIKRITKKEARNRYNKGQSMIVCCCKINPLNCLGIVTMELYPWYDVKDFDSVVNEFEFYNCNYETGYYSAFYIEK